MDADLERKLAEAEDMAGKFLELFRLERAKNQELRRELERLKYGPLTPREKSRLDTLLDG